MSTKMSKSLSVGSIRRHVSGRSSRPRSRSSNESNHLQDAADVLVKIGTSMSTGVFSNVKDAVHSYKKKDEPATGGVGSLLVNMGNSTAAVGGFCPKSRLSEDDCYGAQIFMSQLGTFIAQDQEDRSSLSFCEVPDLGEPASANDPIHRGPRDHAAENTHDDDDNDNDSAYETPTEDFPRLDQEEALSIDENPFDFTLSDDVSISSLTEDEDPITNQLDITFYARNDEEKLRLRALLDTGAGANIMREELVIRTGYAIDPLPPMKSSLALICGNGERMHPLGKVKLRWYFNEMYSAARSYEISFLVCPNDAPFDVVLGYKFLRNARLFTFNREFAMVLTTSDKQKREQAKAEEAARRRRDEEREERRRKDRQKRKQDRQQQQRRR